MEDGILLEIFGKNNMKVIDYLLDQEIDVSISDICDGTDLSRKTVDNIVTILLNFEIIKEKRKIGKTQMLVLNKENQITEKLIDINEIIIRNQERKVMEAIA